MNPIETARQINIAHDERVFGVGTQGGDRNWEPPFHGTTRDGRRVTVSFGRGSRKGETLICDGHVDLNTFYGNRKLKIVKGHDHFAADGSAAKDRGKYTG